MAISNKFYFFRFDKKIYKKKKIAEKLLLIVFYCVIILKQSLRSVYPIRSCCPAVAVDDGALSSFVYVFFARRVTVTLFAE